MEKELLMNPRAKYIGETNGQGSNRKLQRSLIDLAPPCVN